MERERPQVAAIFCPLWHNYDHASSWKGEGWCEWELLKAARPRYPGHYQPIKPAWGCFDESDPQWSVKEIDLAADNGIDLFLVDWYWYSGVRIMEEALEKGLLQAPNRERVKFALMWANHDWSDYFPPPFGRPWNMWLPQRHTPADWERVIDYCIENYFRQPHYWQLEGGLFFSVFQPLELVHQLGGASSFRSLLDKANVQLNRAGLPALRLNAMCGNPGVVDELKTAGFDDLTNYNIIHGGKPENGVLQYPLVMEAHAAHWREMAATALPYMPVVTTGWDVTPRCEVEVPWPFPPDPLTGEIKYPYIHVIEGNTPERFAALCRNARAHLDAHPGAPRVIFVNAWNEWTEGCYLLPEERYGTGYLDALKAL